MAISSPTLSSAQDSGTEASASTPSAKEAERSEEDGWRASFAATAGLTINSQDAKVRSVIVSTGEELRPPASGNDLAVSPYVGLNVELMTPAFSSLPGRPRLFVNGEVLPTFAAQRLIALEGDPKGFEVLLDPATRAFDAEAILGQGSSTAATVNTGVYAAAIGVAFPFEFRERNLRIKPSIGWLQFSVDVEGRVLNAFKPQQDAPADIRFVTLTDRTTLTYNSIGPGIELELDTDPILLGFRPTLFMDLHAYRIVGDRSVVLTDSVTISDSLDSSLGAETYAARWEYSATPWIFRTGIGIRFAWVGRQD
ncbi:MAG: hypothetical protein JRH17_06135 [Deltaproteobacteria bacterium]|nr:hypothetical protein [Deltaproteobacteria bacterium]